MGANVMRPNLEEIHRRIAKNAVINRFVHKNTVFRQGEFQCISSAPSQITAKFQWMTKRPRRSILRIHFPSSHKFYSDIRSKINYSAIFAVKQSFSALKCPYKFESGGAELKPRSLKPGDKNIIGGRIVAVRKERGIKQKDLLAKLQVMEMEISATGLSRLEGQHRLVQDFEVVLIAKALGVDVKELLGA